MICQRCAKDKDDIHTCRPSQLVRKLEQEIVSLRRAREELCKGQEPVAWIEETEGGNRRLLWQISWRRQDYVTATPLYLHPAPIPADMVMVPREPSYFMVLAGERAAFEARMECEEFAKTYGEAPNISSIPNKVYAAMIAAYELEGK